MAAAPAQAAACPPSTTLDELMKAWDDAVSGPGDKDRACLRQLLLPEARVAPLSKAADGTLAPRVSSLDEWIERMSKRGGAAFYERQVKFRSETYSHLAQLWSNYEIRPTPDGKFTSRGINSFQAVFDGARWRILEVMWQTETPQDPVPEKYLP